MKIAVVMKVRMTLPLPLIFLLMISGESQMLQHHFKMFSAIAHLINPLYLIRDVLASLSLSISFACLQSAEERGSVDEVSKTGDILKLNYDFLASFDRINLS